MAADRRYFSPQGEKRLPQQKKTPGYCYGDRIRSIEQFVVWGQLSSGGMFFWRGMLKSFAFLQNWQLRVILEAIKGGHLYAAQKVSKVSKGEIR
jgi:hypothetical protein